MIRTHWSTQNPTSNYTVIVTALCWGSKAGRHWDGIEDPRTDQQNYDHPASDTWGQTDHRKKRSCSTNSAGKAGCPAKDWIRSSTLHKINSESNQGPESLKPQLLKRREYSSENFFPSSSQGSGSYRKEEAGVMGDSQETVSSPHSRTDAHVSSLRPWLLVQDLHRFTRGPGTERKTKTRPLTPNHQAIWKSHRAAKDWRLIILITLRAGLRPRRSWPTES